MDNVQVITRIVTTVGFPIVAAGAMFWFVYHLTVMHREETESMRKTIESNTNILMELKELIRGIVRHD